jgi:hypothetical protein
MPTSVTLRYRLRNSEEEYQMMDDVLGIKFFPRFGGTFCLILQGV